MALDLVAIREALTEQIRGGIVRDVNGYAFQPDAPMLPCFVVQPAARYVAYHESFSPGAVVDVQLEVLLLASPGAGLDGQRLLDGLLSIGTGQPASIIDAIEEDRTLGGVVADTIVRTAEAAGRVQLDEYNTVADTRRLSVGIVLHRN